MSNLVGTSDPLLCEPGHVKELSDSIQSILTQMQNKFDQMSESILARIDEMGQRADELERNAAHIISKRDT